MPTVIGLASALIALGDPKRGLGQQMPSTASPYDLALAGMSLGAAAPPVGMALSSLPSTASLPGSDAPPSSMAPSVSPSDSVSTTGLEAKLAAMMAKMEEIGAAKAPPEEPALMSCIFCGSSNMRCKGRCREANQAKTALQQKKRQAREKEEE